MIQTKIKTSAVAVALSAGLAATSAGAINVDNADIGPGAGSGAGELFFSAWDTGRSESFILDLNVAVSDFVGANASVVGTSVTSSPLAAWLAGADPADIVWNVAGVSNIASAADFYTISTIDPDSTYVQPGPAQVQGAIGNAGLYVNAANQGLVPDAAGDFGIFAIADGLAYFGGGAWGASWGGNYAFDNAPEIDETAITVLSNAAGGTETFDAAFWDLDPTTGTVAYVPVPAAVWLFGSALGLLGAVRRKMARASA